jgi:mono/diheme cytochrome c family protein
MRASAWLALVLVGCTGQPDLQSTAPSQDPPPTWGLPISGGNLLVTRDGTHAIVADPDRDRIYSIAIADSDKLVADVALDPGDEPGRLVEDGAGRIHVALRRGGALLTLDANGAIISRRAVCREPRGLAWDSVADVIHVACATGELVTFPASAGEPVRRLVLDRDLRDVVVSGPQLIVTRFKTAELLTLDAQGTVVARTLPPTVKRIAMHGGPLGLFAPPDTGSGSGSGDSRVDAIPAVAWRTIAMPNGELLVAHQRQIKTPLFSSQGGYGPGCDGPVEAAITMVQPGQSPIAVAPPFHGALPVDTAVNPAGTNVAFALAGRKSVAIAYASSLARRDDDQCGGGGGEDRMLDDDLGAPTSVAYAPNGELLVFYPELPGLVIRNASYEHARTITLPGKVGYDAGRNLFHSQTGSGLACASCHPEGREDGLVWTFDRIGVRRTQSLGGGILARAPYHWTADMYDLPMLMSEVFTSRMAGGETTRTERLSLGPWLDRIPAAAPTPRADPATIARGSALFDSTETGCTTCHRGPLLTNNMVVSVGSFGMFKPPSLVGVAARPPYMHDGCASTLRERFGTCGGGDVHGKTSQLTAAQLDDLVAYLESL